MEEDMSRSAVGIHTNRIKNTPHLRHNGQGRPLGQVQEVLYNRRDQSHGQSERGARRGVARPEEVVRRRESERPHIR